MLILLLLLSILNAHHVANAMEDANITTTEADPISVDEISTDSKGMSNVVTSETSTTETDSIWTFGMTTNSNGMLNNGTLETSTTEANPGSVAEMTTNSDENILPENDSLKNMTPQTSAELPYKMMIVMQAKSSAIYKAGEIIKDYSYFFIMPVGLLGNALSAVSMVRSGKLQKASSYV